MQDGIAEGHAIVVDMQGSTLTHLAKVNIIGLKKFMFYIQVRCSFHWQTHGRSLAYMKTIQSK